MLVPIMDSICRVGGSGFGDLGIAGNKIKGNLNIRRFQVQYKRLWNRGMKVIRNHTPLLQML